MLWIKSFHIIAMVCWFAALFYLPRLFVYHSLSDDAVSRERFTLMERKLYRGIMTPSMVATIVLGFWLASYNWSFYMASGWFHAKLTLVSLLLLYHFWCAHLGRQLARAQSTHSDRFYRIINELPVLILIGAVVLVVVRPF